MESEVEQLVGDSYLSMSFPNIPSYHVSGWRRRRKIVCQISIKSSMCHFPFRGLADGHDC